MDENTIGIVTFKVMFKGSDFIQIGLNDDPNEVFNFWRENSNIHAKWGLEGHVQLISAPKCSILYEIKLHFLKSFLRGVTLGTFGTQYITPFFKSFLGRSDISDKWNITSFFQIFPGKE